MMFTTTIKVNNIYITNIIVIIPIIWLYITVVIIISFCIMVSCTFISLLLVIVGIIYIRVGSIGSIIISILFDGENISFGGQSCYIYK